MDTFTFKDLKINWGMIKLWIKDSIIKYYTLLNPNNINVICKVDNPDHIISIGIIAVCY